MQIKRELEVTVVSNRHYVIRRSRSDSEEASCAVCGEPMLVVEQAAKLLGVSQRRIFRLIENGTVHFAEPEAGTAMICIASMAGEADVLAAMPARAE